MKLDPRYVAPEDTVALAVMEGREVPSIKTRLGMYAREWLREEIIEFGLDPDVISTEAYLKARAGFLAGRYGLAEFRRRAKRYQREFDERDELIGELFFSFPNKR